MDDDLLDDDLENILDIYWHLRCQFFLNIKFTIKVYDMEKIK